MSEINLNELMPENGASSEAQRRAEKINAIKNSMRRNSEASKPVQVNAPEPEVTAPQAQVAATDEWESEIATRIAKRVQQMKNDKKSKEVKSTDSLIAEIDRILSEQEAEAAEDDSIAEEELQKIPQTDESAQPAEENNDFQDNAYESGYAPAEYQENQYVQEEAAKTAPDTVNEEETSAAVQEAVKPAEKKKAKNKKSQKKKKKQKKTVGQTLLGLLPSKKDRIGERLRKVVFLGSVAAIIVCGYVVADYYIGNYLTESRYNNVMDVYHTYPTNSTPKVDTNPDDGYDGPIYELMPGAQKLLDINDEVVGVIRIPGTEVNYPIVQSDDLEKYLHLDFTGKEARAGSIFLDYRCRFDSVDDEGRLVEPNSDNQIIYGHNMADEMMFGSLRNYKEYDYYYGEHPIIELNSNYQTYTYKIFAFFLVDADDKTETAFDCWNNINFPTEEAFYDFVNEAKRRTLRLNDVDVEYGDKLLTLSTCNSIFGNGGSGRFIVLARQVREGEDPYEGTQNSTENTNIKWPNLYYKYKNATYDPDAEFIPYGPDGSEAEDESNAEE